MTVYLDNAATSFPKPPRVRERLGACLETYGGSPGRGSYPMARAADAVVAETRRLLADLWHIGEPSRVVFALNATDALNMAIKGVLRAGDHVVTTVMEHNSVTRPLNALERQGIISVTRVEAAPTGLVDPDDVRRALTDRTRLVAVLHASNVTGTLQPMAEIGRVVREAGRLFLVDAAQTAGAVPIDVEAACADLLAFPGHKGLLGPPGTGGLYVGPRADVRPWREGGTGVFSEAPLQPEALPLRWEAGSPNTWGIALLGESVRYILQRGVAQIRAHELAVARRVMDGLRDEELLTVHGPLLDEQRVAVVSVTVAGAAPEAVAAWLADRFDVAVRAGLHCAPGAHRTIGTYPMGTVRISPGCWTTPADIDVCLDGLKAAARECVRQGWNRCAVSTAVG